MYKRHKRSFNGNLIVGRPACVSTGNRENIVNEPRAECSQTNGTTSQTLTTTKGTSQAPVSVPVPPVSKEPATNENLVEILSSCGMDIETDSNHHVLRTDQAVFIRSLTQTLFARRNKVAENVTKFMDKFKEHFSNSSNFLKALSPTTTSSDCDIARGSVQENLIRLLLQIEELQNDLSNYLLDKLAELGLQNNEVDSEMTPITWVKLILQPFRYLNSIVNSKALCERLFDVIFSSSDRVIQQEVIICLPDIIADSEHQFVATELSKLLKCELELMPSILDALTNLNIHKEIKRAVRDSLITTIKTSPIEYLPNIVKYLLCTCESDTSDELISNLRSELFAENSVSMKNTFNEEDVDPDTIQVLLFTNIRNCLLANKQLADAWMKNISHSDATIKNRPLDIIITIILYDICAETSRKRSLETLIRSRIKSEFFNVPSILETFEHFRSVIIEYFSSLMSILSKLLKSTDSCITEFVTEFYLACFENTDIQQSKTIIKELLAYIGAGDANDAQSALNILSAIAIKHPEKIRPVASMLRVLLNKLADISLNDVRQLMDILCSIAFSELGEETGIAILREDITKLIEKQFSSSHIKSLRIGIITCVMGIKHVSSCAEDDSSNVWPDRSSEASEDFEEHALSEKGRRALQFLRLIIDNTRVMPEAQGFAFDEFSLMLMNFRRMDKTLLSYTAMVMKENMKKYFLICNDDIKWPEFVECAIQFNLSNDEDVVVLNLIPALIEEMNCNASAGLRMYAIVLPSLLRLVRGLEYEDLREIDVLLESPVMMPAPKVFEEFGLQSPDVQTLTMDSLFYLVNWFRELVCCFAREMKKPSGKKVLQRLRTLIWLQKMIAKYLPQMLVREYCPPKCHFHKDVKPPSVGTEKAKKKPADKKKKEGKTTDIRKHLVRRGEGTQQQSTIAEESDGEGVEKETQAANLKNYKNFFRELDIDLWIMLSFPLTVNPTPDTDWEFEAEFGPSELLFVVEDMVETLNFVLITSTRKNPFKNATNTDIGLTNSSVYANKPEMIVKNSLKLIARLCNHLEVVSQYCKTLLENNDHILDATGMFLPESREIKTCYALILKAFHILFSWSGFDSFNNTEMFSVGLAKMCYRMESSSKSQMQHVMVVECVNYLVRFQETVLHLECAVNLVSLVEVLAKRSEQNDVNKQLGEMCWNFLSHRWYDWNGCEEKGATFNRRIEYLLTTFFNCSVDKLKAVSKMCEWLITEITTLNNRDSSLSTLPNINKANCNILIRVLLKILAVATKEALEAQNDPKKKLQLWVTMLKDMETIVSVLKSQPARVNLISFVKGSTNILRLFLTQGIAVCSQMFRTESSVVTQVLKTLQISTRYLQKIFDNTRVTEDSALCAYMPSIRSLLESIILKVKNIMVINGCTEAFFVGSMRNKDLQGQDILSQTTTASSSVSERMDVDEYTTNSTANGSDLNEDSSSRADDVSEDLSNENVEDQGEESDVILSDNDDEN